LADDETKKSRYSILKSAATIALLSVAVGAVAATAGAALLPEAAVGSGVAAASVAGGYLAKGMTVTKTALVSHSGTIAKLCEWNNDFQAGDMLMISCLISVCCPAESDR
jgi:hypothetical protein